MSYTIIIKGDLKQPATWKQGTFEQHWRWSSGLWQRTTERKRHTDPNFQFYGPSTETNFSSATYKNKKTQIPKILYHLPSHMIVFQIFENCYVFIHTFQGKNNLSIFIHLSSFSHSLTMVFGIKYNILAWYDAPGIQGYYTP